MRRFLPDTEPTPRGRRASAALRLAPWALVLVLGACGDASAPEGEAAPVVVFVPEEEAQRVDPGGVRDFEVRSPLLDQMTVRWIRGDGDPVIGPRFRFEAGTAGAEVLQALVRYGAESFTRTWSVTVAPPGSPAATFVPSGDTVILHETESRTFRVETEWALGDVAWTLDDQPVAAGGVLVHTADAAGARILAVSAAVADTVFEHAWALEVLPLAAGRPPTVPDLAVAPAGAIGRGEVAWTGLTDSVFPVVSYEVRCATTGPVTAETWDTALSLAVLDHSPTRTQYSWRGTPLGEEDGAGARVWFAVRARDDRDLDGDVTAAAALDLPDAWWITGVARGTDGTVPAGVRVGDRARLHTTLTDATGAYRLGPYVDSLDVVLEATTPADAPAGASWHVTHSDTLRAGGTRQHDFVLVPRHGVDPLCPPMDGHFLLYLRTLTGTIQPSDGRPNLDLYRWEDYPVPVHVPEFTSEAGFAWGPACREAVDLWNTLLGVEVLTVVDDPAQARIRFDFTLESDNAWAITLLDQPGDGRLFVGQAVPEAMTVTFRPDIPHARGLTEIALHEFGHTLGLYSHTYCSDPAYLMYVSGLGALANGPENAIHPDELHAVHTLMALPQGTDMGLYPADVP